MISLHHTHNPKPNQCTSTMVQNVHAPLPLVWSVLRRFDQPQAYKTLVKECTMLAGRGGVGSVREVALVSGLPGKASRERLDQLDDGTYVMVYSMISGDQRLNNFQVVDVPEGNSQEETTAFVNTVLGCHLRSLASVTEKLAIN
ncbi:abscisic acid receptor pyl11 [Phtheirospermum japonicum]|uniref:Abscisic acid receptor pyl11 n=1 Tax=Phtheirospermum japonicum TaxID=374723 RepID=A0A830C5N9_9LAMI|nr:abscisic acid receptor pyl11 [Phtheirospermum japonicum]